MSTERSAQFLMANLGVEVSRFMSCPPGSNDSATRASYERTRKITDQLLSHPELRGRIGEVLILQDVLQDFRNNTGKYKVKAKELEDYFMPFIMRELTTRGIVKSENERSK